MNFNQLLLAADVEALIKVVFFLIFGLVYLLNHLFGDKKKEAQKKAARRPVLGDEAQAAPQSEIEQFLARARAKEVRKEQQKAKQQAKAAEPAVKRQKNQPKGKQPVRRLSPQTTDYEQAPASPPARIEGVADHVRKRMSEPAFAERSQHLTDDLSEADRKRDEHRKSVFEHKLGRLGDSSSDVTSSNSPESTVDGQSLASRDAASLAASLDLASMLSSPNDMRRAIVLSEILNRPLDRWS